MLESGEQADLGAETADRLGAGLGGVEELERHTAVEGFALLEGEEDPPHAAAADLAFETERADPFGLRALRGLDQRLTGGEWPGNPAVAAVGGGEEAAHLGGSLRPRARELLEPAFARLDRELARLGEEIRQRRQGRIAAAGALVRGHAASLSPPAGQAESPPSGVG